MSITFQSLLSSSAGNCLLVRAGDTTLLIDAGFRSQRSCREVLEQVLPELDAVIVSHLHSDHINYSSLRVLESHGVPLYVYHEDLEGLRGRHFKQHTFDDLSIQPFGQGRLHIGDLAITPFQVPHVGPFSTFGFELGRGDGATTVRAVVATDLWDWDDVASRFHNADFIYVESNHDPELLRRYPNPNSRFHLRNEKCAWLLRQAFDSSQFLPVAVTLGHLSEERNDPEVARVTTQAVLEDAGHGHIPVHIAPRSSPSPEIDIHRG